MKSTTMLALVGAASARQLTHFSRKREVPQEHAHQDILNIVNPLLQLNNPLKIQDAVFALLGNKAAAEGAPNVDDLDCLQQIVADQAFSNAVEAGDVDGQAAALIFRGLERNTGSVGLASVLCTQTAENAEIAAITQHQDPASPEASGNADIEIAIAIQLAAIGADPLLALGSATFAAGEIGDPTAAGNTCDVADDDAGCINSQNLLTPAASEDDIKSAVAAGGAADAGAADEADAADAADAKDAAAADKADAKDGADAKAADKADKADAKEADKADKADAKDAAKADKADAAKDDKAAAAEGDAAATAAGVNVQSFTGTLGAAAPAVISSAANADRPFSVNGATFVNEGAAVQRSCDVQKNACANAANSGQLDGGVGQCEDQKQACEAAAGAGGAKRAIKNKHRRAALDFGSCDSPAIQFGIPADRKEEAFSAVNDADFNHGSALNIKVIAEFNCNQLTNKCDAPQETVDACDDAASASAGEKGQAAADAFNSALGISA